MLYCATAVLQPELPPIVLRTNFRLKTFKVQTMIADYIKLPAWLLVLFLLTASHVVLAETKYVTDKIVLELHTSKSTSSPLVAQLPSGAELEVLEKDGAHARVETTDGKTGWVEAAYLMSSKPAQVLYEELKKEHQRNLKAMENMQSGNDLQLSPQLIEDAKNIGWMRGEMNKARERAKQLEDQLKKKTSASGNIEKQRQQYQSTITELETKLQVATIENEENMAEINRLINVIENKELFVTAGMDTKIPLLWFLIAILVFLIAGVVSGMYMLDAHNRKRHGGFRI